MRRKGQAKNDGVHEGVSFRGGSAMVEINCSEKAAWRKVRFPRLYWQRLDPKRCRKGRNGVVKLATSAVNFNISAPWTHRDAYQPDGFRGHSLILDRQFG